MSATVPPIMVEPVDPNAPYRKLAMITIWMFCDLDENMRKWLEGKSLVDAPGNNHEHWQEANARAVIQGKFT